MGDRNQKRSWQSDDDRQNMFKKKREAYSRKEVTQKGAAPPAEETQIGFDPLDIEIKIKEKEIQVRKNEIKVIQEQLNVLYLKKCLNNKINSTKQESPDELKSFKGKEVDSSEGIKIPKIGDGETSTKNSEKKRGKINWVGEAEKEDSKKVYVVYNGPKPGIYTSWLEASKAIVGFSGIIHTAFTNRIEAEESYANVKVSKLLSPIEITKNYSQVVQQSAEGNSRLRNHGNIPRPVIFKKITNIFSEEEKDRYRNLTKEQWLNLYNLARKTTEEHLDDMKFYTIEKDFPSSSKFNILEGADPVFVYKAFNAGLIENLYPGNDLKELNYFPENFKKSIINFKRKIKAMDKPVYLRCFSSIMDWNQETPVSPYHFIKLGLANTKREVPRPKILSEKEFNLEELCIERGQMLSQIYHEIGRINNSSEIKVNYYTNKIIITSRSNMIITEEDNEKVIKYEANFNCNGLEVSEDTKKVFCHYSKKKSEYHKCIYCIRDKEVYVNSAS